MGIGIFRSSSSCTCKKSPVKKLPNPDPKNFKVLRTETVWPFLVAEIQYPDCTNYEGRKILVFKYIPSYALEDAKEIDPHFCDGDHLSPFARFEPTEYGWNAAINCCYGLKPPHR